MPEFWWWIVGSIAILPAVILLLWHPLRTTLRDGRLVQAKKNFHRERERLEAKFIRMAASQSKSDAPKWADCEFDDAVAYVRDRSTGELSAFVAVTVAMEGLSPVNSASSPADLIGNLRAGTAVFRLDGAHWETDGRAILNYTPIQAIRLYQNDIEVVAQESAYRAR
ncbi:MAG: hypothetical protein ABSG68_17220 [Thermoguttaceae bacterium]|jgi:hypothetical protein